MEESGSQNISARETKNLSPLAKDVLVLRKELASLCDQIQVKSAELDEVNGSVACMRDEFKRIRVLKQPLIESLEKKIEEKRKAKHDFELSVIGLKKEEDLVKTRIQSSVKEANQLKAQAELELELVKNQIEMANRQLNPILKRIEDSSVFLKKLEGNVNVKLAVEEEIKELAKKRTILVNEISAFEERKESVMALFKDLNKYRDELDGREKELIKDYQQVQLMKARLKPKYLKAFKKYANL